MKSKSQKFRISPEDSARLINLDDDRQLAGKRTSHGHALSILLRKAEIADQYNRIEIGINRLAADLRASKPEAKSLLQRLSLAKFISFYRDREGKISISILAIEKFLA